MLSCCYYVEMMIGVAEWYYHGRSTQRYGDMISPTFSAALYADIFLLIRGTATSCFSRYADVIAAIVTPVQWRVKRCRRHTPICHARLCHAAYEFTCRHFRCCFRGYDAADAADAAAMFSCFAAMPL